MQQRYSSTHQYLHWVTALSLLALLPIAWVMVWVTKGSSLNFSLHYWHETLGLIVLFVTLYRLVWRAVDPPPALPGWLPKWDRTLARCTYGLFYAALIWMPLTGYLMVTAAGFPPKLFDLISTPAPIPKNAGLAKIALTLHVYGQWLVYCLLILHVGGVAFQLMIRKSGVLGRMLPPNAMEPNADHARS